jgi:Fe2+ transport system protein FeoA
VTIRTRGLATDLLHHGHKVRGVAGVPTCLAGLHGDTPPWDRPLACRVKKTTGSLREAVASPISFVRPTNLEVRRNGPWDRPLACRVKKTTGSLHKAVASSNSIV